MFTETYLSEQKLLLQIFKKKLQEIKSVFNFMNMISESKAASFKRHFYFICVFF